METPVASMQESLIVASLWVLFAHAQFHVYRFPSLCRCICTWKRSLRAVAHFTLLLFFLSDARAGAVAVGKRMRTHWALEIWALPF